MTLCGLWRPLFKEICFKRGCISACRSLSTEPTPPQSTPPEIKPPGPFKTYVIDKYMSYIDHFEVKFGEKYPKAYKLYRLFKDGIKEFLGDTRMYYSVATDIWGGQPLHTFTRKELEVYKYMPRDLVRSAPVIIAAPLPFVPYVLYPIAYMFPRQMLCRHFWTQEQRLEFGFQDLQRCLPHYPRILTFLKSQAGFIHDPGLRKVFTENILAPIDSGSQPELEAILDTRQVFISHPFSLEDLSHGWKQRLHMWHLARGLDLTVGKEGLLQDAKLLYYTDCALLREGLEKLSLQDLQQSCLRRGLNAQGMTQDDLLSYLQKWTKLSSHSNYDSLSMILHAPVLLAYNSPTNVPLLAKYPKPSIDDDPKTS